MKKRTALRTIALCGLTAGLLFCPSGRLTARAEEIVATVYGTVLSDTSASILYLSTEDGVMEIKLDDDTDTSACKVLIADKRVGVSLSHGSDGYLHAEKITGSTEAEEITIDSSTAVAVSGTLSKKSRGNILYFKTPQGDMEIEWDDSTDMSGCSRLVPEKNYTITCARGSDAYQHALRIADASGTAAVSLTSSSSLTPAPADPSGVSTATAAIIGTSASGTKDGLLFLETEDGTMQIVIDENTDTRNGLVLTPGNRLTVSFCRGSDAYLHAVTVTGVKSGESAPVIDTSAAASATVTGTVAGKSTEDLLYLNTSSGSMELKLDALQSVNGLKALYSGRKVTVVCARGSDAYLHAISITAA